MNLQTMVIVVAGVLLNAAAQLMLKAGTRALGELSLASGALISMAIGVITQPFILGGLACYVVSVGLWIIALSRVDVTIAYPMNSIGYVVNAVLAWQLFGEQLGPGRIVGIAIILAGVVVLARS